MTPERARNDFTPSAEQRARFPVISGNAVNGLGETDARRLAPIYWHNPATTPHGRLQAWYQSQPREPGHDRARAYELMMAPLPAVEGPEAPPPGDWTAAVKEEALSAGAGQVGIARLNPDWVFEGKDVPFEWLIVILAPMVYERLALAPSHEAAEEVLNKYAGGPEMARRRAPQPE